uniref:hypothetical protein n=1 Tax=Ruminococcus bromii TaxID=40518 RepID=UPI003FEFB03F
MIDCSKTENYLSERLRMTKRSKNKGCDIKCSECPLSYTNNGASEFISCITFEMHYPLQAISIVQRWSDEHPKRTYLSEFLKNYPNAPLEDDGTPEICLSSLGLTNYNGCRNGITCSECWNQPVEDGESE